MSTQVKKTMRYNRGAMTSFVIIGKNKEKRVAFAVEFCANEKINKFDVTFLERDTSTKQAAQSIGIEDIKRIQKKLFLKPLKSKQKAVIIEDASLLTPEAQNALLKVLEEPPAQTIIILGADSKESLLPTILSRCTLIALEEDALKFTAKEREEYMNIIERLPTMSLRDRLKTAEQIAKDKDKAQLWMEKCILIMRDYVLAHPTDTSRIYALRKLQTAYTTLKTTNINPRFTLEITLLQL